MSLENELPFLRSIELFHSLSDDELKSLLPYIEPAVFNEGDWLVREEEDDRKLYIIKSGIIEVLKREKISGDFDRIGVLGPGECIGEMAHFDKEKRSASIRAVERVEALIFSLEELNADPTMAALYSKITVPLVKKITQRLRKTDQTLVESLREKLKIMQAYNQVSTTIIHVFICLAIWFNLSKLVEVFPSKKAILDPIFTFTLLAAFGVLTIYVIRTSGYPLSFYGLKLEKWPQQVAEALLYSIPAMILILLIKWLVIQNVEAAKPYGLFLSFENSEYINQLLLITTIYVLIVPFQELVIRGFLQSCFRNFFIGSNRVFFAILTSNLIFQLLHTIKSFWLAVGTFFLGIFWGALFEKQKSLVGVSFSHALIGIWAYLILDLQPLFDLF